MSAENLQAQSASLAYVDGEFTKGLQIYGSASFTGLEDPEGWRRVFGFDFTSVDQDLEAGGLYSDAVYNVLRGRFDPERISAAVRSDPSMPEEGTYGGVPFFSWEKGGNPPAPAGELGLAITGEYLLWAASSRGVTEMLDTRNGAASLADLPEFQLIADELTDSEVHSAIVGSFDPDSRLLAEGEYGADKIAALKKQGFLLLEYQYYAIGLALDGKSLYSVLILVNADSAEAKENAMRLKHILEEGESLHSTRPWHEEVEDIQVDHSNRVVTARFKPANSLLLLDALRNLDALLLAE